jgi:hypothetical protein
MLKHGRDEGVALFVLRWLARALSLFSVGVILLFLVGEGFDPSEVSLRQWAALVMFPGAVVGGMIVAWRREGLGGAITVTGLLALYLYSFFLNGVLPRGPYLLILSAPGFLFLLYWFVRQGTDAHRAVDLHS